MSEQQTNAPNETKKGIGRGIGLAIGGCLGLVGIIVVISIIAAVVGAGSKSTNTNQPTTGQPAPAEKKVDVASFYNQVQNGQTKEQVTQQAGKAPYNCTESESQFGKYEICSWGDFSTFVTVSFMNGAVESKTKTGF